MVWYLQSIVRSVNIENVVEFAGIKRRGKKVTKIRFILK